MPITLTVVRGPQAGRAFTLDGHETFLVGRSASAHFSLPDDPYFSRHHFLVESNPPLCQLTDLESHNGTLVNGRRVTTAELHDGDEVEAGRTVLRVSFEAAGEPPPADPSVRFGRTGSTLSVPGAGPGRTVTSPGLPPVFGGGHGPPAVPGYRDLVELGRGGMGVVYRATRAADGATVAVKTVHPAAGTGQTVIGRFLREARVLQTLAHPRVVSFHEMGEAGGVLYFVMDYVPGTDASRLVHDRGPLPPAEAVGLGVQLCDGLAYAHGRGFVHRDVKPGNLLVTPAAGGGWDLRVADFGLARTYQESPMSGLTVSGDYAGTPAFMPPEQVTDFRGVKPAADQYAAAATVFYLLTGRAPYEGGSPAEVLKKVLAGSPPRADRVNRSVPAGLAGAVHRAMSVKPTDRFPAVGSFADAMREAV